MAKAKVKWNFAEAGEVLLRGAAIEADIQSRGEAVLEEAQVTAPFESGDYEESLQLEVADDGTRVKATIKTVSKYGAVLNVITNHLANALRAAGGNSKL